MGNHGWLEKYIHLLRDIIPAGKGFLVGGVVRDRILGRGAGRDIDIAVDGSGLAIARKVADICGGAFVPMDEDLDVGRVVLKDELVGKITIDISALRGSSIEEDLSLRDFTINAIGESLSSEGELIDPVGGMEDLRAGIIKACYERAFLDDPVRIPRAFRFHAELGFCLEDRTALLLSSQVGELRRASKERVRDELMKALSCDNASRGVKLAQDMGVIEAISGYKEVKEGADRRVEAVRRIFGSISDEARRFLSAELSEGRPRISIVLLSSIRGEPPFVPDLPLSRAEVRELMAYQKGIKLIQTLWGRMDLEEIAFELFWEEGERGVGAAILWGVISDREEEAGRMVGWYFERMRGKRAKLEPDEIRLRMKGEEIRDLLKGRTKRLVMGDEHPCR